MKLLWYQEGPADRLEAMMRDRHRPGCGDFSDMGTGKTYVACEVMRRLDEPTLVIGPKISRSAWVDVGRMFGVDFDYVHYDEIRRCKTQHVQWIPQGKSGRFSFHPGVKRVLFDEGHRCSGIDSLQAKLMIGAVACNKRPVVITATVAESPIQLKAIGYALGLHTVSDYPAWIRRYGCSKGGFGGYKFTENPDQAAEYTTQLHRLIFPDRAIRIRKSEIPNFNAGCDVQFPLIDVERPDQIDQLTGVIRAALEEMEQKLIDRPVHEAHPMVKNLRARQTISLLKTPAKIELAKDYLAQGARVAFFENFKASIAALKEAFPDAPVIDGDTSEEDRVLFMRLWNEDKLDALILNEQAGGLSISLHRGLRPLVSIVEPNYSIKTLRQVWGRTDRSGGLVRALVLIPVAADSIEVDIRNAAMRKNNNLDLLNDGDLFACVYSRSH